MAMAARAWQGGLWLQQGAMDVLLVNAHPLAESLNARLAAHLEACLTDKGHSVIRRDLYAEDYEPRLSPDERAQYYADAFEDTAGLAKADGLALVFPTWWFGLPAILKGWIDRSFLPGVAYDHAPKGGPMVPRLSRLQSVMAVTTLGAPWIYDTLVMRQPVKRCLKWGLVKPCAPKARFRMDSLYNCETVEPERIAGFEARIAKTAGALFPARA
jgi:NAD(P)H dehydrogenase (quinone)